MKVRLSPDGSLVIDLFDGGAEVDGVDPDVLLRHADSIGCLDSVIEAVADQIIDGWTKLNSHGNRGDYEAAPQSPLGKAIQRVAVASGEVAAKEIRRLVKLNEEQAMRLESVATLNRARWLSDSGGSCGRSGDNELDEALRGVIPKTAPEKAPAE